MNIYEAIKTLKDYYYGIRKKEIYEHFRRKVKGEVS